MNYFFGLFLKTIYVFKIELFYFHIYIIKKKKKKKKKEKKKKKNDTSCGKIFCEFF